MKFADQANKSVEIESRLVVARGWGKGKSIVTAHGYEDCFGGDENVLELIVVMATQFCVYIKNHETVL